MSSLTVDQIGPIHPDDAAEDDPCVDHEPITYTTDGRRL